MRLVIVRFNINALSIISRIILVVQCCLNVYYELRKQKGHRLGTANEIENRTYNNNNINDYDNNKHDIPKPIIDENLTDTDREKIRADRAAAAEARLKKQGLPIKPKKTPPVDPNAPLRGPNSKSTMTWSLG